MSRWFRYYDDALNDPKVQKLSGDLFKAWVNLLCLASKSGGEIKAAADAAFALRVSEAKAREIIAKLAGYGLLDPVTDRYFEPHNWCSRQFKSDVSNDRVKRFRERERNVTETPKETPPETEAETEAETQPKKKEKEGSATSAERPKSERKKPSKSISDDWRPSSELRFFARGKGIYDRKFDLEMEKFRNHARTHDRKCVNWDMAARNWLLGEIERKGISPPRPMNEALAEANLVHILEGSEEMDAWDRYWRQTKGVNAPRSKHGGIFADSQWPPNHETQAM